MGPQPPYGTPARDKQKLYTDADLHATISNHLRQFKEEQDRALAVIQAQAEARPLPMDAGLPFLAVDIDLTGTVGGISTSASVPVDQEGFGIYYREENSNPQGRLQLIIGGQLTDIYPGQRVQGYFRRFEVLLSSRSSVLGVARLIIEKRPDVKYLEPGNAQVIGERFVPIDLLGTSASSTFIAQTITSNAGPVPSGASPSGSFDCTGYRSLRLLVDGKFTSGGTVTTFNVIPWLREPSTGQWYEQGTELVNVPDTNTTGGRYRVLKFSVFGKGKMYFQFTGWAGTETGPGQIVQALE